MNESIEQLCQTPALLSLPVALDATDDQAWKCLEEYAYMLMEAEQFEAINFEPAVEIDSADGWSYEHWTYTVDPDMLIDINDRNACISDLVDMLLTHEMRHWVVWIG